MIVVNTSDFGWNEIDKKYYLVSYNQNKYYELNSIGRKVWEWAVLKQAFNETEINCVVNTLSSEYNIEPSKIYEDILVFFQSLKVIHALIET